MKTRFSAALCFVCLVALCVVGCTPKEQSKEQPKETITLATTTSTQDSGLLDVLVPMFEKETGIEVKVVAVGTGAALKMGKLGDADVLLTHAPQAEQKLVDEGFVLPRQHVMHNDFVIVGPKDDPAKLHDAKSVVEAFETLVATKASFISRGDDSGTNKKELHIWAKTNAKPKPKGKWYIESGDGMGATLRVASERQAYTLTDRGTFLSQSKNLDLAIAYQRDPLLKNDYAVMVVNPEKHKRIKAKAAKKFAQFLLNKETQKVIKKFGVQKFGEPLFFPNP